MNNTEKNRRYSDMLLKKFNGRDSYAFGCVYDLYYTELHYYAAILYRKSEVDPPDIIQDVFANIWTNGDIQFASLEGIKSYLYRSIRNSFNNFIVKRMVISKYENELRNNEDAIMVDIIESETYTLLESVLGMLPKEGAEIFKLIFEGWSVDEIAEKLGKQKQTIYNKKHETIKFLKDKLSKDKMLFIVTLFGV